MGKHLCVCGSKGKKAPKRKPKGPTKTQLRLKADIICGGIVRARAYCQAAGRDAYNCGGRLQWAHLETGRNLRLRWELWGSLCLCAGHHRLYTHRPTEWTDFLQQNFPDELALVRKHRHEYFDGDYETLIANLQRLQESLSE